MLTDVYISTSLENKYSKISNQDGRTFSAHTAWIIKPRILPAFVTVHLMLSERGNLRSISL